MRKLLTGILAIVCVVSAYSQDPQFSQFYSNPLYLGASFAGAVEGSRICASYRDQWRQAPGTYTVKSVSYDHYFSTFNSGIGILGYQDVAGSSSIGSTNLALLYSYNFQIFNVWHIRPGLSFSYIQYGVQDGLLFMDEIVQGGSGSTGAQNPVSDQAHDIDVGTSALVYTKKFWMGTSFDHLLTPDISLYASESNLPVKFSLYGGYEFRRRGKLLKPSDETMTFAYLFKKQKQVTQLDLGVYWHNHPLVLGLWYRGLPLVNSHRGDAVVLLVGIKTRGFNIGYSYDITISNLIGVVRDSHELALTYKFLLPERVKKGGVPCPEF